MSDLTVGLVGAGHISGAHLKAWKKAPGCEVRGIYDVREESARAQADAFRLPGIYEDLDRLVDECDVVDICTPPHTHAPIMLAAIDAGKHLLIEKPVVTDVEDWDRLLPRLEGASTRLAVIHNLKFSRGVLQARGWLEEGRIGKLLRLSRYFLTSPENDRMLAGGPHWSHDLPGGRWFETLPHELYLTHSLAGPLEIEHVTALRTGSTPVGVRADEVAITLRGESTIAEIHFSANCRVNKRLLVLDGERGTIMVDILSDAAALNAEPDRRWRRAVGTQLLDSMLQLARGLPQRAVWAAGRLRGDSPHSRVIDAFVEHLMHSGPSPTPLDEVDYVVRNCDRIGRIIDEQAGAPEHDASG